MRLILVLPNGRVQHSARPTQTQRVAVRGPNTEDETYDFFFSAAVIKFAVNSYQEALISLSRVGKKVKSCQCMNLQGP